MEYPLEKYKIYNHKVKDGSTEIIAVSTYCGKEVKGKAKCHPSDTYNFESGKMLAALRCNEKIAKKRYERAVQKELEAKLAVEEAINHYNAMVEYRTDSAFAWQRATDEVNDMVGNM